ncbi:uncharacterized protein CLUP02_02612 [Colletotrichum lupini]|uniref:Uncharacterized protein n=1 Tax=Colletotrichum lupini TaxID=145971 RepID=A0A9Q8SH80_9PEZI|nr:uncharacterized protein CLUP02_02612 [Colletotrichum lupini]UQC77145.1 hypothetical protein CLUP02_02612 [Colletotrichum lupini]
MWCRQAEAGKRHMLFPLNVRIHRIPYSKIGTKYIVPDYLVASAPITYHGSAREEQVDSRLPNLWPSLLQQRLSHEIEFWAVLAAAAQQRVSSSSPIPRVPRAGFAPLVPVRFLQVPSVPADTSSHLRAIPPRLLLRHIRWVHTHTQNTHTTPTAHNKLNTLLNTSFPLPCLPVFSLFLVGLTFTESSILGTFLGPRIDFAVRTVFHPTLTIHSIDILFSPCTHTGYRIQQPQHGTSVTWHSPQLVSASFTNCAVPCSIHSRLLASPAQQAIQTNRPSLVDHHHSPSSALLDRLLSTWPPTALCLTEHTTFRRLDAAPWQPRRQSRAPLEPSLASLFSRRNSGVAISTPSVIPTSLLQTRPHQARPRYAYSLFWHPRSMIHFRTVLHTSSADQGLSNVPTDGSKGGWLVKRKGKLIQTEL